MIVGFIGDTDTSVAEEAKKYCSSATLLCTTKDLSDCVYYTSIGDLPDLKSLIDIVSKTDVIYYCPPAKWSNKETKEHTELVLEYAVLIGKQVKGFVNTEADSQSNRFSLDLADTRKTHNPQLWIVGCSIAHGVGVDPVERFGESLKNNLGLETSWLTKPGSSISWASDQIIRSDIASGDLVCWGLTSSLRTEYFDGENLIQVLPSTYLQNKKIRSLVPIERIEDDNHLYQCFRAVEQARNHCKKVGARLLIIPVIHSALIPLISHLDNVRISVRKSAQYIDYGADNEHPGPLQHSMFAKLFLNMV